MAAAVGRARQRGGRHIRRPVGVGQGDGDVGAGGGAEAIEGVAARRPDRQAVVAQVTEKWPLLSVVPDSGVDGTFDAPLVLVSVTTTLAPAAAPKPLKASPP